MTYIEKRLNGLQRMLKGVKTSDQERKISQEILILEKLKQEGYK